MKIKKRGQQVISDMAMTIITIVILSAVSIVVIGYLNGWWGK